MSKDTPKDDVHYYTQKEVNEAVEESRSKDGAIVDIDYPVCEGCGWRHPSEEYLRANALACCKDCGKVGKVSLSNLDVETGGTIDVTKLPLHRRKDGRWCY